jgi:hypothetical protein
MKTIMNVKYLCEQCCNGSIWIKEDEFENFESLQTKMSRNPKN